MERLKSNIRIKSNLYIRSTVDGSFSFADEDHIAQIKNRAALKKLSERAAKSGIELKLSDTQKAILNPRSATGGTSSFGGEMPAVTPMAPSITAAPDNAVIPPISDISETPKEPEVPENPQFSEVPEDPQFSEVSENPQISEVPEKPQISEAPETPQISEVPEKPIQLEKIDVGLDNFSEIESSEVTSKIIESGTDTKIVLDSVNYSEKIRIASERISFILKNDPKKRVLVLCGTDIAAERIKHGASDALANGSCIDMLDVFAAKYLSKNGESAAKITSLTKNEKLAMFNDKMKPEYFAKYDYCLISDLDELVAENVKTVLKIIVLLKCGFLLLSDRRRATLKYGVDSVFHKNASKLCDVLPENTKRFSLGGIKHGLSEDIGSIISALTDGRPSEEACKALLSKMESAEISSLSSADGETAVLCGDGGCAEYVSLVLHENNIPHAILRGDKPALVRQLADILWDSHEKIIGRDNFIKRFIARCGSDENTAEKYFNKLCSMTKQDPSNGLEFAKLAEVISLGGIPLYMLNISNERLTVAEISSPYGRVFNKVYIADSSLDNSADPKLLYLAAAGRTEPPALLKLGNMPNTVRSANGRWIHIGADGKAAFGMGYPEDIDISSFISGSMGDAVRKQAYISKNVKPGDNITLKLNGAVYDIIHGSTVIGKTSAEFCGNIAAEFGGQRYFDSLPEQLGGIYVTDVTTVISCRDPSEYDGIICPQFRDHRFWYGVELSGFAKIE